MNRRGATLRPQPPTRSLFVGGPKPQKAEIETVIRQDVLQAHSRRVALIIADAEVGSDITASIVHCRVSGDELRDLHRRGIVRGGFDTYGNRTDGRIFAAPGAYTKTEAV